LALRRIRCEVEYVGAAYAGFQRQPGKKTVQATLERAITAVTQAKVTVDGAGRTDAGAHACAQVVAFTTGSRLPVDTLARAINVHLPRDIAVTRAEEATTGFHPRYDAVSRTYRYLIWNRPARSPFWHERSAHIRQPLDVALMHCAAQCLIGHHDLGAFAPVSSTVRRVRRLDRAACTRDGHLVAIELQAEGFMKQMVRAIAGTLCDVGRRRLTVDDFRSIVESADRRRAGVTMPAYGLYLMHVSYSDDVTGELFSRATDPLTVSEER
jgi:tRNA pseudouridine38-40 synthase